MSAAATFIIIRFVHYLGLSVLFGVAFFQIYGVPPSTARDLSLKQIRPLLLGSALVAEVSALWFGSPAAEGADATIISAVWLFRLVLAAVLVLLLAGKRLTARRFQLVLFGSFVLLVSVSLTGHLGNDQSQAAILHRIADAFHLAAAGVWIGALVVFARAAITTFALSREEDLRALHYGLSRFSEVGPAVVIALALSGVLNPNVLSSFNSAYGQVLLVKLSLFAAMLLLAAANRYWLTPAMSRASGTGLELKTALHVLQASLLTEMILAIAVLAIVARLGTISPPAL